MNDREAEIIRIRILSLICAGLWSAALPGATLLSQPSGQEKQDYPILSAARFFCGAGACSSTIQRISAGAGEAGRDQDSKPDLVASVDFSGTAHSIREVSINTTVKNIGSGPSPGSLCDLIIRNARPPRQVLKKVRQKIRELDPGDVYTFSFTVKTGFGMYEVCAFADSKKSVDENDETNNRSCTTLKGR